MPSNVDLHKDFVIIRLLGCPTIENQDLFYVLVFPCHPFAWCAFRGARKCDALAVQFSRHQEHATAQHKTVLPLEDNY